MPGYSDLNASTAEACDPEFFKSGSSSHAVSTKTVMGDRYFIRDLLVAFDPIIGFDHNVLMRIPTYIYSTLPAGKVNPFSSIATQVQHFPHLYTINKGRAGCPLRYRGAVTCVLSPNPCYVANPTYSNVAHPSCGHKEI